MTTEIRVLLVAPEVANIDASPEIRSITALTHVRTRILLGYVSARDVFDAAEGRRYDILHFATHANADHMALNGNKLKPEDVSQIARLAQAKAVFFNSCSSGRFGSYLVQQGLEYAIYANIDIEDAQAWKLPYLFYQFLDNQIADERTYNIPKAFNDATDNSGNYGITSAYDRAGILPIQGRVGLVEKKLTLLTYAMAAGFILQPILFVTAWLLLRG